VHWYSGYIGGRFQSYTIGNILSAQFYAAALKGHPEIPREIARGEFGTLRLAARQSLPARQQVRSQRSRQARHQWNHEYEAIPQLSSSEVRSGREHVNRLH
jgi:Zn-dependent M32 family carboxypeptidase